ncbi:hypothetical protein [Nonomuraea aurantiaca]|uniref:hypothetical protein n=1 Tax=Nonomuraea aurantiaca TaxID=2878562 RepID=UPI001CDA14D5|nr:hypothetical protein [Nonomuraea aurantiaca]MCA2230446.1 hypothetical protein [Nonomuraea aurantiaca]
MLGEYSAAPSGDRRTYRSREPGGRAIQNQHAVRSGGGRQAVGNDDQSMASGGERDLRSCFSWGVQVTGALVEDHHMGVTGEIGADEGDELELSPGELVGVSDVLVVAAHAWDPAELAETLHHPEAVEPLLRVSATLEVVTTVTVERVADLVLEHVL